MANMIKLSEWASRNGINYQTAYRWYKAGKLPAKNIVKTPTGTILVEELEPEYTTEKDEAIMSDDSLPLAKRLVSAYKYIQSQKDSEVIKKVEDMTSDPYYNKWQDKISDEEKQKLLEDMNLTLRNELPTKSFPTQKPKSEFDALKEDFIKLHDDYNILKDDVNELMSNVFGDGKRLLDRIETRNLHEIEKTLKALIESAKSFDDLKRNYEEYKNAVLFSEKHKRNNI